MEELNKTIKTIHYQFSSAHPWIKELDYARVKLFVIAPYSLLLMSEDIKYQGNITRSRFEELLNQAISGVDQTFNADSEQHLFFTNLLMMIKEVYEKNHKGEQNEDDTN